MTDSRERLLIGVLLLIASTLAGRISDGDFGKEGT